MQYILMIVGIFTAVILAVYAVLIKVYSSRMTVLERIKQVDEIGRDVYHNQDEMFSFSVRIIKPVYKALSRLFIRIMPKQKINTLSKRLENAGILRDYTIERWRYQTGMFHLILAGLTGIIMFMTGQAAYKIVIGILFMVLSIQVILRFYISGRISRRKEQMSRDLPFTLDLITVSVEAGLSFDGAIARVIQNIQGELSIEFAKMLKETKMGIERKVALRNMSDRCEIKELSMFISSLIQADHLGVSLGNILRIESEQMREHRKQAAREKAMKAPIKMLFPLIIFIFPAIFVIILGPAVIKMIQIFMG